MGLAIFIISVFVIVVCLLAYLTNDRFKKQAETKKLFQEVLRPACLKAKTEKECLEAWELMKKECIDGGFFKMHISYRTDFFELKNYLEGKINIIRN